MKARKLTALILSCALLLGMATVTASASRSTYSARTLTTNITYNGNDLGATYSPESTTFKVWAPTASAVMLNRYSTGSNNEAGSTVLGRLSMELDSTNGVWSYTVTGDIKNTYYTYSVTVDGKTTETQDVYSFATGVNGERSMVVDLDSTNPDGWSTDKHVLSAEQTDAVIWEVHVRDFSINASSGVSDEYKGKYLAFTQGGTTVNGDTANAYTCIDYLVNQGVKYVHLNPVYDFGSVDETRLDEEQFNWGYDPVNYNVPDGSYSTNPYDGNVRIKEFKQMVQALHDRGIGVIMDVVYNHTYSTSSCFQSTVPDYYYRMTKSGDFSNGSGCGNETKSEAEMFRKYMIDSVSYWAEQYHIDGFRFDLMGLHDYTTMNQLRSALDNLYSDGSGKQIIMYGEPWTGGPSGLANDNQTIKENASQISDRIAFFNNNYRDAVKGSADGADGAFVQNTGNFDNIIKAAVSGNIGGTFSNGWTANAPTQNVLYQSAHDNLTLFDKFYSSLNGAVNSYTSYSSTAEKLTMLAETLTLTGQGMPFALAGEEFCRTKQGEHNSYNSPDKINSLDWTRTQDYSKSVAYYKGLLEIRDAYSPFSDGTNTSASKVYFCHSSVPAGCLAYTLENKTANASNEWKIAAVLVNTTAFAQSIKLEGYSTMPASWTVIADDKSAGVESLKTLSGSTVSVPAQSAMILVDTASFNSANVSANTMAEITVNHINKDTGKTLKSTSNLYNVGDTFRLSPDADLSFYYDYAGTDDTTSGIVSADGATVNFYYTTPADYRGTVTINYFDQSGDSVKLSKVIKTAENTFFKYSAAKVQGYSLDTGKLPANMAGTMGKSDVVISFYYKEIASKNITVHYNNSNDWTRVYFYCYTTAGEEPISKWPGKRITAKDADGYYVYTVEGVSEAQFCFNNGESKQDPAANIAGYSASGEVWISEGKTTFNTTIISSYVDVNGNKLAEDDVNELVKTDSTNTYSILAKTFAGYSGVIIPANATGYCTAGIINVVFVYNESGFADDTDTQTDYTDIDISERLYGDVDSNNKISLTDVIAIQRHLAELSDLNSVAMRAADVNGDGKPSMSDVTDIQRFIAGLITEFEAGKYLGDVKDSDIPADTDTSEPVDTDTSRPTDTDTSTPVDTDTSRPTDTDTSEPVDTDISRPTDTDTSEPVDTDTSRPTDTDTSKPTDTDTNTDTSTDTSTESDTDSSNIVTLYFSNNVFWDDVYVYMWSNVSGEYASPWCGIALTALPGTNEYGETVYSIDIDLSKYDKIIFNNGFNEQTVDIDISDVTESIGFYILSTDNGLFTVGTYPYQP